MSGLRPALSTFLFLLLITGGVYPLLTTALGQWWFPWQANGSLIREGDTVRGSALIGQNFTGNGYFHGRPSATAEMPYNPQASGGSNLAAKEAGNMVDLDSNPTKLIEVVHIGKQMLMTRGSLTTFSIANDVAKYFAIIPAAFAATYPQLNALNIMRLHSPDSAILSAVIFNALIIVFLIPLALKGVSYKPLTASAMLRRNLWIYGLGGLLVPFIGIKVIDLLLTVCGLV